LLIRRSFLKDFDVSGSDASFMDLRATTYSVYANNHKIWMENQSVRKFRNVSTWLEASNRLKVKILDEETANTYVSLQIQRDIVIFISKNEFIDILSPSISVVLNHVLRWCKFCSSI